MGLYTQDEINLLKKNDPRMLQSFLDAINGELRRRTADGISWSIKDTTWLIERVNDIDIEDTAITSKLELTDSVIEKITNEVINNPRIVEDETISAQEIEWTDILLTDAGIVDPSIAERESQALPVVDENAEYDRGFPPTAEDRIEEDPTL
tara:strand:- start:41 stop:493 length:453 start_codon:yes stop_codon:yes gene_type:complete